MGQPDLRKREERDRLDEVARAYVQVERGIAAALPHLARIAEAYIEANDRITSAFDAALRRARDESRRSE